MHDAFHVPLWLWGVALAVVLAVAAADVIHASRSQGREPGLREAALWTAGVVALGALFGLALAAVAGPKASGQFYAGWLTEYSLSLDNLFVFVLLIGGSASGDPAAQPGPAGRDRPRPAAAGCVHRGGGGRTEPLRLGAVHLRGGADRHRGADGRRPGQPSRPPPSWAQAPRPGDPVARAGRPPRAASPRPAADLDRGDRRRGPRVRDGLHPGGLRPDPRSLPGVWPRTCSPCSACATCTS